MRLSNLALVVTFSLVLAAFTVNGFVPQPSSNTRQNCSSNLCAGKGFFADFFEELDAFVDDATSRRLGAGSAFYGKRKSNFYGKNDKGRKQDRNTPDPMEDYQAPAQGGYFKWKIDEETGQMKPVTRMKEKVVERNPKFWDRVYGVSEDSTTE